MPTPDRTTIKAALEELIDQLSASLVAEPPTAGAPFRSVAAGIGEGGQFPGPFLFVRPVRARSIDVVDDDRLIEVTAELRIVTDVPGDDSLSPLLDAIGAVDDFLDSVRDTGILEGAEGFDDRTWEIDRPRSTADGAAVMATGTQSFVVKVQRGKNRAPAA